MVPLLLLAVLSVAEAGSVWEANPFRWDTVQDKLYSFCYGDDGGPLSPAALAALGKSKMMIHGMEEGSSISPRYQNSEAKVRQATDRRVIQMRSVQFINDSPISKYTLSGTLRCMHDSTARRG